PSAGMKSWDPSKKMYVSPEDYLKQPAIYFRGEWITRREIIRYIANIAHGVHSGEKLDEREELLRRARFAVKISGLPNAEPSIIVNLLAFDNQELPPFIDRTSIDWFLVELWSAASSLVDAPDVHQLEAYIKEEN
ncbi:MAG: hypothetical protein J0G97_06025, partial [Rhizobium pusense]|nr:hypothetical protein [Agrobacterium pusense]